MPTRINKYIAQSTGMSRRAADKVINDGRILINNQIAVSGEMVVSSDKVTLDDRPITPAVNTITIIINKPKGYVCSRNGQGSKTIYDLLPKKFNALKPVGRLDKDSSGLILLTNDGILANQLTHPKYAKKKIYEIELDKPLEPLHQQMINDKGIGLDDGLSKLSLEKLDDSANHWQITMTEGRNRQIRRTFGALGYKVTKLHRTHFGSYVIGNLKVAEHAIYSQL